MIKRLRIAIVDDHPMVAEGLQSILESYDDIEVVGNLNGGRAVIAQLDTLDPDVILMDLNMPDMGGLSATEIVLEQRPGTRIVILSMHDSPEYISSALNHGAMGYLLKDVPTDEIKLAIDTVMRGERYLCTGAQGSLTPKGGGVRETLTGREQTILLQLAQGQSNKEVALTLDISVRTVETHRKNLKRKLGISSTAGLTRYALEHGVLQGTGVDLYRRTRCAWFGRVIDRCDSPSEFAKMSQDDHCAK
jgi:two-component system NarL family response regulator